MVKHVILWKLNEVMTEGTKEDAVKKIKHDLEDLNGKIPGLISLSIITPDIASSNADIMLDSSFESEQALAGYAVHPLHVAAASFVRANTQTRLCIDYTAE